MTKAEFDEFADDYSDIISKGTSFFDEDYSYFPRSRSNIVKKLSGPNIEKILDFGCGVGLGIRQLCEAFPNAKVVGCDPSQSSLEVARTREPNCEFVEPSALPPAPTFDVAIAVSVFHHIQPPDRIAALRYCFERLKPRGHFFIFEHNPFNPVTRRIVSKCPVDKDAILLTKKEAISRLERAGFNITATGYCLFFPKILAALRPLEETIRWLPLGGQYFVVGSRPL